MKNKGDEFKMIKFEHTEVLGFEHAIRGLRNPMNSWDKSDSDYRQILCDRCITCKTFENKTWEDCDSCEADILTREHDGFMIGPNDLDLMKRLRNAGTDHRKFMRMIVVYVDITAPLYWWKEFDTYAVGVVKNSCSTMHCIHKKEFMLEDFSCEHFITIYNDDPMDALFVNNTRWGSDDVMDIIIRVLNYYRQRFLQTKDKKYWWQMIQLLPSSYNQKRTVMLNYEVLANIAKKGSRRNHKLDEWRVGFMDWIKSLPYSELIIGEEK